MRSYLTGLPRQIDKVRIRIAGKPLMFFAQVNVCSFSAEA